MEVREMMKCIVRIYAQTRFPRTIQGQLPSLTFFSFKYIHFCIVHIFIVRVF